MEEWIGGLWHKYITRKANPEFDDERVYFDQVSKSVAMVFRALGGDVVKRVEAATGREYLTRKSFLQKISGDNQLVSLAWQDEESLRLPESLAVFNDKTLNYDLYIWLAVLAAHHDGNFRHWAKDNQALVVEVLEKFPALHKRYCRLAKAFVAMRPPLEKMQQVERIMEQSIRNAILTPGSVTDFPVVNFAPKAVYLWLYPSANSDDVVAGDSDEDELLTESEDKESDKKIAKKSHSARKKAERVDEPDSRGGMMIFRLESLFSWSEFSKMDRGTDDTDEDEEDYQSTIDDLDKITLSKKQEHQKSGQIKIDLDLPSASQDDIPLGEGIKLPEWNYKTQTLQADRCLLQPMLPRDAAPAKLPVKLQKTAKMIQAQFEQLRSVRYWLKAQPQGEELDLNAWLDFHIESKTAATAEKGLFKSYRGNNRDLSCLLLADLSMSTDSHLDNDNRVIDVVKQSLM